MTKGRVFHWRMAIPALLTGLVFLAGWRAATAQSGVMKITYINVGQGDSALVQGVDGFDILIDGGKDSAGPTVVAYLREAGVDDIDVLLASHNDADHIGGLLDVLAMDDVPVVQALYNGYPADSDVFRQFATAAAVEGAPLQAAQFPGEYTWGAINSYILNPPGGLPGSVAQNNASVVSLLQYGNQRFLFPGDLEVSGESQVLLRGTPVAADVLKVGHHGSDTSTSPEFLAAVGPTDAVISVGNNSYGHPSAEVIERLKAAGVKVWRTDIYGHIWVASDGSNYTLTTQFSPPIYLPLIVRGFIHSCPTGNVSIETIFYNGVKTREPDEYVEIKNIDSCPVQLAGWKLRDAGTSVYTFPSFVMAPGQVCRVYTNEDHPEWCGFNWGRGSPVWNNDEDCGRIEDSTGLPIDEYCYVNQG